jgi:hypothetical protein
VCEEIRENIRTDSDTSNVDIADPDSWDNYAHEWADGSEWVIYYANSRALWADEEIISGYEDEAAEFLDIRGVTIDQWITATVYLAVRAEILEACREIAEERGLA